VEFGDSPREAEFRREVRAFLQAEFVGKYPSESDGENEDYQRGQRPEFRSWRRKLAERGWIAAAWPQEYGGAGLGVMEQFIMNEEFAEHRVPPVGGMGVMMVGPTLIVHGNEQQKKEHLSRILSGETRWCQGFSEPEAGSDLASLQTRAVRDGDDFVINGQKIWTSGAHRADWMFMLARTDPEAPKHKGITYFLVDMKSPGIEVRPLTDLSNRQMFSEVFFEDVRVPASDVVGELNRGWYIGTTTLDFERSSIGSAVGLRHQVDALARYVVSREGDTGGSLPSLRWELADRYVEAHVARLMSYRVVTMQAKGLIPNYEASMTKLYASELTQRIAGTAVKLLGLYGQLRGEKAPKRGRHGTAYLRALSSTIAGGTSEIQRSIIATRGLGLPRN